MPEWAQDDPRAYWRAADEHERANGSLYREVEFALPKELSADERKALAVGFASQLADAAEAGKLPYTLAIHKGGEDGKNPHAHLMISVKYRSSRYPRWSPRRPSGRRAWSCAGSHARRSPGRARDSSRPETWRP